LALNGIAIISTSVCDPVRAFHNTDNTALVINPGTYQTCQMLQPTPSAKEGNDQLLARAVALPPTIKQPWFISENIYRTGSLATKFRDAAPPGLLA